jgi:BirA family biotin operon repressor/biotin-[acetyl-CoA-carboxylase] ligase
MANALFVGKVARVFDEISSTNDYARSLAHTNHIPEGFVVRARQQTGGRGQQGTTWESAPDQNLTLSILLRPTWLAPAAQFGLSLAVALAVRDTVANAVATAVAPPTVLLKWPNDLYLGSRKTGGILIENVLSGGSLLASVVGIGLNVNQLAFSPALRQATSLALASGQFYDLDPLAERLFEQVELRYAQLQTGQLEALRNDYYQHLLGFGQVREFEQTSDGHRFEARVLGVADDGQLRLLTTDLTERTFGLKDLRWMVG